MKKERKGQTYPSDGEAPVATCSKVRTTGNFSRVTPPVVVRKLLESFLPRTEVGRLSGIRISGSGDSQEVVSGENERARNVRMREISSRIDFLTLGNGKEENGQCRTPLENSSFPRSMERKGRERPVSDAAEKLFLVLWDETKRAASVGRRWKTLRFIVLWNEKKRERPVSDAAEKLFLVLQNRKEENGQCRTPLKTLPLPVRCQKNSAVLTPL